MTVFLSRSCNLNDLRDFDYFLNLSSNHYVFDTAKELKNLAGRLENHFDQISEIWWRIGKELGIDPTSKIAHTPTCAPNVSDLGLILAWAQLIRGLAKDASSVLVVCDDPWLFRHLSTIDGVRSGSPPRLLFKLIKLHMRGIIARLKYSARAFFQLLSSRAQRVKSRIGGSVLLVYGHPSSKPEGDDGYFGPLMKDLDCLTRVLHVDCPTARARYLCQDSRTVPISAWGSLFAPFMLPLAVWRPAKQYLNGQFGWLIKRASALEASTAQPAAIAWQIHCQSRWLLATKPRSVAWPWENHGWEREFIRQAKKLRVATTGYQHSVIGTQMYNYSPASNPDGEGSLPDQILCTGLATYDLLIKWGFSRSRLSIAGALRIPEIRDYYVNPTGKIFLALPFDGEISRQMVSVACHLVDRGFKFIVGVHPMTPFRFNTQNGIELSDKPFYEVEGLSSLVFAATTVGLEAALAGIPIIRFQPKNLIALNILPEGLTVPTATADTLEATLKMAQPVEVERTSIFSPVSIQTWKDRLAI